MDTSCGQSELKLSPKGTTRANVVPKCHRKFDSWKRGPRTLTPGRSSPPFGTQLGGKGLPKSSFLVPSRPKINKNDVQGRVSEKCLDFDWNLFRRCKFLNVLNSPKCFISKHFGGFRWLWQNREFHENLWPNGSQKSSPNRRLGDQGSDFWGFWPCFEDCDLLMIFEVCQNRPKMTKVRHLGGFWASRP